MVDSEFRPRLIDYLPAIYHRSAQIGAFLAEFDAILFDPEMETEAPAEDALAGPERSGTLATRGADRLSRGRSLEQLIRGIAVLFDPDEAEPEFLPWLAQWAALSLHEGIPESRYRLLIGKMIPLYGIRGTKAYVEQTLALYTGVNAVVEEEDLPGLKVGVRATVGIDTRLGQDPFQFRVALDLSSVAGARERLGELLDFVDAIVNLSKPAHTHFRLTHNLPAEEKGLVIFVRSTVGIDTFLWK
jgi:phage tail-like protein